MLVFTYLRYITAQAVFWLVGGHYNQFVWFVAKFSTTNFEFVVRVPVYEIHTPRQMCCVDDTEASTVAGVGSSTFSVGFVCASRSVISEANVDGYMKQGTVYVTEKQHQQQKA